MVSTKGHDDGVDYGVSFTAKYVAAECGGVVFGVSVEFERRVFCARGDGGGVAEGCGGVYWLGGVD